MMSARRTEGDVSVYCQLGGALLSVGRGVFGIDALAAVVLSELMLVPTGIMCPYMCRYSEAAIGVLVAHDLVRQPLRPFWLLF
jgi:hypothetical protein